MRDPMTTQVRPTPAVGLFRTSGHGHHEWSTARTTPTTIGTVSVSSRVARLATSASAAAQVKALTPVSERPIKSFWTWLVPSYKVMTRASRRYFCTGYSSMKP